MANPMHPQSSGRGVELKAALSVIPTLPRAVLARLVARAIERLDEIDGDPDLEPNGDEEDGSAAEDDFMYQGGHGPGCDIADPGGCDHDGREPDHDHEIETWSHWLDHPEQLHIGQRPGGENR